MQSTQEQWRPITGYEGWYEVSNLGQVRRLERKVTCTRGITRTIRGRILKQGLSTRSGKPRPLVTLVKNGKAKTHYVHWLVLEAFIGPRPAGHEGCHRDDDSLNNTASNLYWGTRSDNLYDMVRNGLHPAANKTHCKSGHEFSETNTAFNRRGNRQCRACRTERSRRNRAAAREARS